MDDENWQRLLANGVCPNCYVGHGDHASWCVGVDQESYDRWRKGVFRRGSVLFTNPNHPGGIVMHPDDPWGRLDVFLNKVQFSGWAKQGWTLHMELQCPHCKETRLVEQVQSHRGQEIYCNLCGRVGRTAGAGSGVGSSSPRAQSSPVQAAGEHSG